LDGFADHAAPHAFPSRRSSDLNRRARAPALISLVLGLVLCFTAPAARAMTIERVVSPGGIEAWLVRDQTLPLIAVEFAILGSAVDRKSTRLNSSHEWISYAVFC